MNAAFASVGVAWVKTREADPARLNVNGGAIGRGHLLGASVRKRMTTRIDAQKAAGNRFGLQTLCEGVGIAAVTIVKDR